MKKSFSSKKEQIKLYVVAIGCFDINLNSLKTFLDTLPNLSEFAFIIAHNFNLNSLKIIQNHLSTLPHVDWEMVTDGAQVKKNKVYLQPSEKSMLILNKKIFLQNKNKSNSSHSVDLFFHSLAYNLGRRSIGVVLNGRGYDGTMGASVICDQGGFVVFESRDSKNEIKSHLYGKFDLRKASAIVHSSELIKVINEIVSKNHESEHSSLLMDNKIDNEVEKFVGGDDVSQILSLLYKRYQVDFSLYKLKTIERRLVRRAKNLKLQNLSEYLSYIKQNSGEISSLYYQVLIGVSCFFRDVEAFKILENEIIPALCRSNNGKEIRVWVPACSSGEEAYSISILIYDYFLKNDVVPSFKVFATDLDDQLINTASIGRYQKDQINEIPSYYKERYFVEKKDGYYIVPEVRTNVVFARHNVLNDPPFTRLHFLSCRNLLIYFDYQAQLRVLSLFYFSLLSEGMLFLGSSETLGPYEMAFRCRSVKWKIYQKLTGHILPRDLQYQFDKSFNSSPHLPSIKSNEKSNNLEPSQEMLAMEDLLQRYVPPSMLISKNLDIIHLFGEAGEFLKLRPGAISTNLKNLLGKNLAISLHVTILRVKKELREVLCTDISSDVRKKTGIRFFTIQPIFGSNKEILPNFLVTFNEKIWEERINNVIDSGSPKKSGDQINKRIKFLENELQNSKENLQSTIEELETTNEELQSTNEELLSSNEELQSTNEELHSVNEELHTVNSEFQAKIGELIQLKEDERNLLESTDIGVVFLDKEFKIRRLTPSITKHFNLIEQDIGRDFSHFSQGFQVPDLMNLIKKVFLSGKRIEREVYIRDYGWFLVCLKTFTYESERIARGVVLTFINFDSIKKSENLHKAIFYSSTLGHAIINENVEIELANDEFIKLFGYKRKELIGKHLRVLIPSRLREKQLHKFKVYLAKSSLPKQNMDVNTEFIAINKDGKEIYIELEMSPIVDQGGHVIFVTVKDITKRIKNEEKIHEAQNRLLASNNSLEQFAYVLSHDLQAPLRHINHYMEILKEEISGKVNSEAEKAIDSLQLSSQKIHIMTKGLLQLAKVKSHDCDKIDINLKKLVIETCELLNIEDVCTIKEDLPNVYGDYSLICQLIQNLLSNAIKFIPKGRKPNIEVGANYIAKSSIFEYYIKDNGVGIKNTEYRDIFKMFSRGNSKTKVDGFGIGLAICSSIVTTHNGFIRVESTIGEGTTFYFTLAKKKH